MVNRNYVNGFYTVMCAAVMLSSVFKINAFATRLITDFDQFLETTPAAKAKKWILS